jgi:hypothetical protein
MHNDAYAHDLQMPNACLTPGCYKCPLGENKGHKMKASERGNQRAKPLLITKETASEQRQAKPKWRLEESESLESNSSKSDGSGGAGGPLPTPFI